MYSGSHSLSKFCTELEPCPCKFRFPMQAHQPPQIPEVVVEQTFVHFSMTDASSPRLTVSAPAALSE